MQRGVIFLLIRRMNASFGKLQDQTLELRDGLNIIQAPNETGKSTWCAFLLTMLYGINSRERDKGAFIADKNRYAAWSGRPMAGRLDCLALNDELTLTRSTRRQTAPMGEFQAVYAGTANAVPDLTGQNCGEALLGVSREVFERSSFIRQNGLAITQDAGLERRIASLITSGEENTSHSEAAAALKKQLTRRRHNKTGLLPTLEAELLDVQRQLSDLETLSAQLAEVRQRIGTYAAQADVLEEALRQHDAWQACRSSRNWNRQNPPPSRPDRTAICSAAGCKQTAFPNPRPSPACGARWAIWMLPEVRWKKPGKTRTSPQKLFCGRRPPSAEAPSQV